jgi:hypothetical protein
MSMSSHTRSHRIVGVFDEISKNRRFVNPYLTVCGCYGLKSKPWFRMSQQYLNFTILCSVIIPSGKWKVFEELES